MPDISAHQRPYQFCSSNQSRYLRRISSTELMMRSSMMTIELELGNNFEQNLIQRKTILLRSIISFEMNKEIGKQYCKNYEEFCNLNLSATTRVIGQKKINISLQYPRVWSGAGALRVWQHLLQVVHQCHLLRQSAQVSKSRNSK